MNVNFSEKPEIIIQNNPLSGILSADLKDFRFYRNIFRKEQETHIKSNAVINGEVSAMDHKPQKTFRAGAIQATVWNNEGVTKDGVTKPFVSVSFDKRYKDKEGAWKSTNSLNQDDLPKAIMVLDKAYEFLAMRGKEEASASSFISKTEA